MYGRGFERSVERSRGRGFRSRGRGRGYSTLDSKYRRGCSDEAEEQVRELFNKKDKYHDDQWKLPPSSEIFRDPIFQITELIALRDRLNAVKSKLNDKDLVSWQRHTRFTNRAASIVACLRKDFQPELCTQGWAKFHEILHTFVIVPHTTAVFKSLHLCEIPGSFITSLNHFLKTHRRDVSWQWKAMSLNPYYEGNDPLALIDQDRFMLETLDQWYLGKDNSGDVMVLENVKGLLEIVKQDLIEVDLVTADGSIDCVNNPSQQEKLVSQLLLCETFTALSVLKAGGTYILKMFTSLECQTICLIYLLASSFNEVHVFKPVASKAGNSEQYVVCLGFKRLTKPHLDKLQLGFNETFRHYALFPMPSLPLTFVDKLTTCTAKFAQFQIDTIEENLKLYECMRVSEKKLILEVRDHCYQEYKKRCKLSKLHRDKCILTVLLDGMHLHSVIPARTDSGGVLERRSTDTLLARMERGSKPWAARVLEDRGYSDSLHPMDFFKAGASDAARHVLALLGCHSSKTYTEGRGEAENQSISIDLEPSDVQWLKSEQFRPINKQELTTLDGRVVLKVVNTRFCRSEALKRLLDVIDNAKVIQSDSLTVFASIVSRVIPCHALLASNPPYFLNAEGLNIAAVDALTQIVSQAAVDEEGQVTLIDLWGAPSSYGQYVYWTRPDGVKGWGLVRSEHPSMRPSPVMARVVQWDSFHIFGSVHGLDITENSTINNICSTVSTECPDGVQLVFGDVPSFPFGAHPPGYEEHHTKQHLLCQCVCALKLLAKGGSFFCRVYSLLTRFSVSLLYLFYRVFEEVAVIKPLTSSPASSEQFIVCKGFRGCRPIISELLLAINSHISLLREGQSNKDVLELLPVQLLFEESFYKYVTLWNERIVRLQAQTLLLLEKYRLDEQDLPDSSIQARLRKGVLELLQLPEELP